MDDSEFAKGWERTRGRGFVRFVMTRGASWGGSLAVFVLVGEWLNGGAFDPLRIVAVLAACTAIGCVFAPLAWHQCEDR